MIYFPLPDQKARLVIFNIHTKRMNLSKNVDLKVLASATEKATGADIKAVCTEAGMFAIRDEREQVERLDFDQAIAKVLPASRISEVLEFTPKPEKMYG